MPVRSIPAAQWNSAALPTGVCASYSKTSRIACLLESIVT